jgi:hypothetical protein
MAASAAADAGSRLGTCVLARQGRGIRAERDEGRRAMGW